MANKLTSSVNKMVGKAAKIGAAFAGLAAGVVIKVGFDGLKELDAGAAKVKSIAKNALDMKDIKKGFLKTSNETGIGVNELSETQYNAISSGVKPNESLDAAVAASKLAAAGFTDSNSALKILTSTMNVYGLEGAAAMGAISDKLLITQNLGVTTVAELADSLGSLTPIASSAGTSIDDLMAGMAALTKNGLKTDEAVTSMKGIMTSVIKPTSEAQKVAKKLGIDFSVGAIKAKGFAGFLEEVKRKTGGNLETMGELFGNVRALSGALILTGDGIEDFNTSLDAMRDSAGATDEAFKIMENTLGSKIGKLKNIAKNTATAIMESQSGAIGKAVDDLKTWIDGNQEAIQGWVETIGGGITKAAGIVRGFFETIKKHQDIIIFIGTFVVVLSGLMTAMGALLKVVKAVQFAMTLFGGALAITPIGIAIVAIAALIAIGVLLWKNWDKVKEFAINTWAAIKESVGNAWQSIKDAFSQVGAFFSEKFTQAWEAVKAVFAPVGAFFSGVWSTITSLFTSVGTAIGSAVSGAFKSVVNAILTFAESKINGFINSINAVVGIVNNIPGVNIGKIAPLSIPKLTDSQRPTKKRSKK